MLGLIFHEKKKIFSFLSFVYFSLSLSLTLSLFNNDLQVELIIFGNFRPFHEQLFVGDPALWTGGERMKWKAKIKKKKIIFSQELRI